MKIPRHKYEVTIKVGANSEQEVWSRVQSLQDMAFDGLRSFVSSSGILEVEVNETQTEEKYRKELAEYMEWRRNGRAEK